jgi:hypothetical protein
VPPSPAARKRRRDALPRLAAGGGATDAREQPSSRRRREAGGAVVYGGIGKAARTQESYATIKRELQSLADDETLLVQSGKPVAIFRTHDAAPRVLIANSNLVPEWATWEHFRELDATRADDVRADDRRLLDLHRQPGDPAGHLRDVCGCGSQALRRLARRPAGGHRRARRHGRRAAACDHNERRRPCQAEHGRSPIELLDEIGFLGESTSVIHGIHVSGRDVELLARSQTIVVSCPTTEGNLGDGYLPAMAYRAAGVRLAIGSDSHVRIDPFEEVREVETGSRRETQSCHGLVATSDSLWDELCANGYASLGLDVHPTTQLDIDLTHPDLRGVEAPDLAYALATCASAAVVARTATQIRSHR